MKFNIICSFSGFLGDKAVIVQGCQARLVRCYTDVTRDLTKSQGLIMSMSCRMDDDGEIWITEVGHVDNEE